jgi:hypothetical protein
MLDMDTVLTHNEDCPVRSIGSGLVIESPTGRETHSIEDIGAFIWARINGRNRLDDILDEMLREYQVAESKAAADLKSFTSQLLEAGLVETVE